MRLTRKAWDLLADRRDLWLLPLISAVAVTIAVAAVFVPVMDGTRDESARVSIFVATAAATLPLTLVSTFFNVAFLHVVNEHLDGREVPLRAGLRYALSRLGAIVMWSLLATFVGLIFSALQNLRGGEIIGRLVGWIGGLAWALATFFVVPALVYDRVGVRAAMRRSASTFKKRWGEQVTGQIVIGAGFGLAMIPGLIAVVIASVLFGTGDTAGGVAAAVVAGVLIVPLIAASTAVTELFGLVVYRQAMTGQLPAPFTEGDVDSALKRRKPPFWRRD
jgi:membrane-anchored glycerophosphoryl diester phosphodiesterase (GDPDase)